MMSATDAERQTHSRRQPGPGGLLGWLGLGRRKEAPPGIEQPTPAQARAPSHDPARLHRRETLDAIGRFLLDHQLDITPANLVIAHGAVTGLNPMLRRKIASQQASGQPITQDWLDRTTAAEAGDDDKTIEQLIARLEQTIGDFRQTAQGAHSATREYGDALARQVDELEAAPDADAVISELAGYARAMLARTRRAEAELRHRDEEAASLRHSLDRARRDAEVDYLTGLPNRRAFQAELDRQVAEARAAGEQLSVAFCDIDHFKSVNDTHGHDAGDRVICVVARTLTEISDDNCHIARHGGEEFVLLFRGSNARAAAEKLDEARAVLAARRLVNRRTRLPFGQISFSGGVADVLAYPAPSAALAAADEALYRAKENGRNRVELADPPTAAKAA